MLTPIIIAGSGATPFANAKALIEDYLAGLAATNGDIEPVIYWALDETSTEIHTQLFDWLHDPNDEDAFDLAIAVRKENLGQEVADLIGQFEESDLIVVQRPGTKAVQMAVTDLEEAGESAEQATLLVLWDDAEESAAVTPAIDAMEEAAAHGIEIRDLAAGLQTIDIDIEEAAGGGVYPTQEELEEMDLDSLKERATEAGLEIPKRSRSTTYAAALNEHYRGLEAQGIGQEEPLADDEPVEVEAVERARAQGAPGADALTNADLTAALEGLEVRIAELVAKEINAQLGDVLTAVDHTRDAVSQLTKLQTEGLAKVVSFVEDTNARVKSKLNPDADPGTNGAARTAAPARRAPRTADKGAEEPATDAKPASRAPGRRLRRSGS